MLKKVWERTQKLSRFN